MIRRLAGFLARTLRPHSALAQETLWERHLEQAQRAHQEARYADTDKFLQMALRLAEAQDPARSGMKINRVGELYESLLGRFDQAVSLYQRALQVLEEGLGPEHAALASSLNNLALRYHDQRRYQEAESFFLRLLQLVGKHQGPDHPDFATCLENYAALLRKTDRTEEAERVRARARQIRKQLLPPS